LFFENRCRRCGREPDQFFARMGRTVTVEDALDDVVDRTVQAALVEKVSLICFRRRKPMRMAQLKVVEQSEPFPAPVVAYWAGQRDRTALEQFRKGMIDAKSQPRGRQLLTLWKLTGFEPVPPDYFEVLADILRNYPPPPELLNISRADPAAQRKKLTAK
jgi:ABC-type phosphate/phosphonate transport system substrate-binding protein